MRFITFTSLTLIGLALSGCSSSTSHQAAKEPNPYTGYGTEVQGTFVYRVAQSSGAYENQHYAPEGLTGMLNIRRSSDTSNTMTITRSTIGHGSMGDVILSPNPEHRAYTGFAEYTILAPGGAFEGFHAYEYWMLNFIHGIPHIHIEISIVDDPMSPHPTEMGSGTLELDLQVPYTFDDSHENYFLGRQQRFTADPRYGGQTGVLELGSIDSLGSFGNVGTYGRYYIAGSALTPDAVEFEAIWKEGNRLTGGGFAFGVVNQKMDTFSTIDIQLNALGKPTSSTGVFNDLRGANTAFIATSNYTGEQVLLASTEPQTWDLKVVSVTEGGILASRFAGGDSAGHILGNAISYDGRSLAFANWANGNLATFFVPRREHGHVIARAWDERLYRYQNFAPSYDMDLMTDTQELYDIDFNYEGSTGSVNLTIRLHVFNATGHETSSEVLKGIVADFH